MDIETILSILALTISIGTALFEYMWNKKNTLLYFEFDINSCIYKDYLIHKIPQARNYIVYSDGELKDTKKLIDLLNEIRQNSLYYKYNDKKFYKKLCDCTQAIEDKLVLKTGYMSCDDFSEFNYSLNDDITNLYTIIANKYKGEKIKKVKK